MKMNARWHSFRLTTHDSGRVRWCIGNEQDFRKKLKILALFPAVLLTVIATYLLLSQYVFNKHATEPAESGRIVVDNGPTTASNIYESLETLNAEILETLDTTFIAQDSTRIRNRKKRQVETQTEETISKSDKKRTIHIDIILKNDQKQAINIVEEPSSFSQSFWKEELLPVDIRKMQANTMKKFMDTSAEPCEDFYQYACGNWPKHNPIPPDRAGYDTFELLRESLDYVLRDLLEDKESQEDAIPVNLIKKINFRQRRQISSLRTDHHNNGLDVDVVMKAKYMYKSCMNLDIIKERGALPLLDILDLLGGWPAITPNWKEDDFDFVTLMGELRLYNNDILISEWIGPDIKNSDLYIIQLDQTSLGLPTRDYFLEPNNVKYVDAYRTYIMTIAMVLGASEEVATDEANEIVTFETELAKIISPPELRRNVSQIYKKVSIQELQLHTPQIDWLKYIGTILEREVNGSESVVCYCWSYLHDLVDLLAKTPPKAVANYLLWRFIRHRANNLDDRFEEAKQRFYKILFGRERSPPRWQSCVTQVNSNLGMALGQMFVNKYFDEMSKNDTIIMTKSLQNSFKKLLINTNWVDDDTKQLAIEKIDAMGLRIGYPNYLLNITELNLRYTDISIHPDYYFENTLSILKHLTRVEQRRYGNAVNKVLWNTPPAVVNAYYSRNKNQIMFPAGILQPPFYHKHFPKCLNYGGIGVVIGHEITHGFDDKGRLFDRDGNLQKWWNEETIEEFHERSQCLIDQYNQYIVPEINLQVDGLNTQGENIADNGGIKQAFKAYQQWLTENPNADEILPDFNVTNTQLFFLNFAQVWCGSSRPEAAKNKLKTAVHSPGRFRVIGALSNSDDFAKSYNCSKGSPMNPLKKCSIW